MRKEYYINKDTGEQVDLLHVGKHLADYTSFAVFRLETGLISVYEMKHFNFEFYKKGSIG